MSRRAARTDGNQSDLVEALRAKGYSVASLAACGHGVPDLIVGVGGLNLILEVKDPDKPPSKRRLTPAQTDFHRHWQGQVAVVHDLQEAEEVIARHLVVTEPQDRKEPYNASRPPSR